MPHSHVTANIRAEVARKGKNQGDLAKLLGITRQGISQRMLGRVDFRVSEVQKIADYLGVPMAALLVRGRGVSTAADIDLEPKRTA